MSEQKAITNIESLIKFIGSETPSINPADEPEEEKKSANLNTDELDGLVENVIDIVDDQISDLQASGGFNINTDIFRISERVLGQLLPFADNQINTNNLKKLVDKAFQ